MSDSRPAMTRLWSGIAGIWDSAWFRGLVLAVGGLLALAAASWVVIRWAPDQLASTSGLNGADRIAEIGRVRTAILAILAGSVAATGAIYTARTFALSRQGQITERFTRAVEQLGHAEAEVRIGGIYALQRLARESHPDQGPIVEILTAYVREHAPLRTRVRSRSAHGDRNDPASAATDTQAGEARAGARGVGTDVQAVLTVLGRRNPRYDISQGIGLNQTSVVGPNLTRTYLEGANLIEAHLEGANLAAAYLDGADLTEVYLDVAILIDAYLMGADLTGAHLERAILTGAHLEGASLGRARLENASLDGAHLNKAALPWAHLESADLTQAHLENADLTEAHLEGARLTGAHLKGANLTGALYTRDTDWPNGFDPSALGATLRD